MVIISDDLKQVKQTKAEVNAKQAWVKYTDKKAAQTQAELDKAAQKKEDEKRAMDEQIKAAQAKIDKQKKWEQEFDRNWAQAQITREKKPIRAKHPPNGKKSLKQTG